MDCEYLFRCHLNTIPMNIEDVGQKIKKLRKLRGLTQRDMALRLFMEERNYAKIERGEKKTLDVFLIMEICKILEINVLDVLPAQDIREASPKPAGGQDFGRQLAEISEALKTTQHALVQIQVDLNRLQHAQLVFSQLLKQKLRRPINP